MSVEMVILKDQEEWLKNRMKGIGGSEISAVIGCNPYMDNITLWKIKTGQIEAEDISDKEYVEYGHNSEHHLRELFKLDFPEYSVNYIENNSFYNDKYPFARASLDGWLEDENGKVLRQNAGKPTYTATLVKYADLICTRPCGQAVLTGIVEE